MATAQLAITLTERAAKEVKRIIEDQKDSLPENVVLRMGIQGGGCSGFQYDLRFDDRYDPETDELFEQHGIRLVVDKRSLMYLKGTELDFYEGLDRRGFVFNNPNARRTCGCGSSFGV